MDSVWFFVLVGGWFEGFILARTLNTFGRCQTVSLEIDHLPIGGTESN